jgi:hypothetical protein
VAVENLARDFDSTDAMLSAWMTSPTHRENIVHSKYKDIGVAVVNGTLDGVETTLVVQMFGTSTSSVAAVGSIPTETREAVNSGVKELQSEQQAGPPAPLEAINPEEPSEPVQEQPSPPYDTRELARVLHYDQSLGVTLANQTENNSYLSPLLVTKAISTSIIMLVMAVLVYDSAVLHRRKIPRVVGKNWAHLIFFSLVVMLIVTMAEGVVL